MHLLMNQVFKKSYKNPSGLYHGLIDLVGQI